MALGGSGIGVRLGYAAAHARPPLAHPADLQRGREPRGRSSPRAPRARARPRPTASGSSSSTTTRPTAPARSPTGSRAERDERRGAAPHRPRGPRARPTWPASRTRWRGGAGYVFEMDADFSHDPADLARLLARGARRRRRPRARLALRRRRRRRPTGALLRRVVSRGGSLVRAARARPRGARPHRRLQVLPRARCSRRSTCRRVRSQRLRLPGRADLPRAARAASASSRCRSSSATGALGTSKMSWRIALEAMLARAAAAPGRRAPAMRRRTQARRAAAPIVMRMNASRARPRPGPATTRARRCGAGTRRPWPVLRPWLARRARRSPSALLLRRRGSIAHARHAGPDAAACCPGLNAPADARRRRPRPVPQLARARAARDGLRRRLHRRQLAAAGGRALHAASGAGSTTRPARWRSPSSSARRCSRSCTQAYVLGSDAATLAAQLDIAPALLLARRCCRTRCPSWSRSSCRSPPGSSPAAAALGRAARRHVRDRRDRRPGPRRWPRSSRSTSRRTCCAGLARDTDAA